MEHRHQPVVIFGDGARGRCACGAELRLIERGGITDWHAVGTDNPDLTNKERNRR